MSVHTSINTVLASVNSVKLSIREIPSLETPEAVNKC